MHRTATEMLLSGRRYLLLQGPMGNFFEQLTQWLHEHKRSVKRVLFNGGDAFFCQSEQKNVLSFNAQFALFPQWLTEQHAAWPFDTIICFGDCRPLHRMARSWAENQQVRFLAFEEGYFRPYYITLEQGGVNAFTAMPKCADAYINNTFQPVVKPQPINPPFSAMAWAAMQYYWHGRKEKNAYPHYKHHKSFSIPYELRCWIRAGFRKYWYKYKQQKMLGYLLEQYDNQYYLAVLQVYNDSQVKTHSDYTDIRDYIDELITSFALHADNNRVLVFKHHPMDRGHRYYGHLISELAKKAGIARRVYYMHDQHLPTMLRHSCGVITINSTVGLSALHHGCKLKVMGRALYDMPGLTCQHSLNIFWNTDHRIDKRLYRAFKETLIQHTQLNGSFFSDNPWMESLKITAKNKNTAQKAQTVK
ncbi:MAG: capsule biosynthesis protein [Plesiomonas sp.]|uniref:capsule biosynthesis protein n=1 Tax=Plesiomonas sp. TaxID=2486279 RepID=UPI003F402873